VAAQNIAANLLSLGGFGSRVRPFDRRDFEDTPLRNMVYGPDEPPDPLALQSAEIAAHAFPGELHRRLAGMAPYPDPSEAAAG
jgi:hypothetical protein